MRPEPTKGMEEKKRISGNNVIWCARLNFLMKPYKEVGKEYARQTPTSEV